MKYWKLGCRWGSKSDGLPLFFDLLVKHNIVISWEDKDFKNGNIVLLTDGFKPLGVARTLSSRKPISALTHIEQEFNDKRISFDSQLYYYDAQIRTISKPIFEYPNQTGITSIKEPSVISNINLVLNSRIPDLEKIGNLLQLKKQIILQGPPGTGKTRLAKQIASTLTGYHPSSLDIQKIKSGIFLGQKINGASDQPSYYTVENISENGVTLSSKNTTGTGQIARYNKIIEFYNQLVNKENPRAVNSHDSYEIALAQYFFSVKNKSNYEIIQFHPSYTYEDFVRGITVKSGENGLEYRTENKTLATLAKKAYENFLDSQKGANEITRKKWLEEQFESFKEIIEDEIESNGQYTLSEKVGIQKAGNQYFKYVGNGWHDYIKYELFIKLFETKTFERKAIKQLLNVDSRSTYYAKLAEKFNTFLDGKEEPVNNDVKVELKNFVLIIDEINRANLSSVLGELIYALEYRGEPVESMYDLNDGEDTMNTDKEIILPPNLFIIGTMNTADRSVGQIDYAIRRRFSFVDVLPSIIDNAELDSEGKKFAKMTFEKVTELFIVDNDLNKASEHLSDEFKPKDVWLGHSYFILEKDGDFSVNLEYEIKPILREYVVDGILKDSAIEVINQLSVPND